MSTPKKPLFPPRESSDSKPWEDFASQTDIFSDRLSAVLTQSKASSRALFECMEEIFSEIHDPRDGEDGQFHLDGFDPKEFEKIANTIHDVFLFQEIANVFGLEKPVKARAMEAYILRHPNLRPLLPRRPVAQPQEPQQYIPRNRPTPPPRVKPKLWTGKKT